MGLRCLRFFRWMCLLPPCTIWSAPRYYGRRGSKPFGHSLGVVITVSFWEQPLAFSGLISQWFLWATTGILWPKWCRVWFAREFYIFGPPMVKTTKISRVQKLTVCRLMYAFQCSRVGSSCTQLLHLVGQRAMCATLAPRCFNICC